MAERGARLLVADDNKVNRLLLKRNLELQGHLVALQFQITLEQEAVDLVVVGHQQPRAALSHE